MISLAVILTLSIVLNVLLFKWYCRSAWKKLTGFFSRKGKKDAPVSPSTLIVTNIENMHIKELVTLRQRIQSVVVYNSSAKIPGVNIEVPGTGQLLVATYDAIITYGNDLSKISISEPVGVNRVRITVPHSRIIDSYVAPNSSHTHVDSAGLFREKKSDLLQKLQDADIKQLCEKAIENGILEQADRNTAVVLRELVANTGLEAEILFIDAPESDTPLEAATETKKLSEHDERNTIVPKAIATTESTNKTVSELKNNQAHTPVITKEAQATTAQ